MSRDIEREIDDALAKPRKSQRQRHIQNARGQTRWAFSWKGLKDTHNSFFASSRDAAVRKAEALGKKFGRTPNLRSLHMITMAELAPWEG